MARKKRPERDEKAVITYLEVKSHEKLRILCLKKKIHVRDFLEKIILEAMEDEG